MDAKAAGFILVNTDNSTIAPRAADGVQFPVFSVGSEIGNDLIANIPTNNLMLSANNINTHLPTINFIAETIFGDPEKTIVIGSHSDGVPEGPGMNDNGSGSASTLEIALNLYRESVRPVNRLRFGWWAAEELGLLGSIHYVNRYPITSFNTFPA
jgi:Zn-dependent M28 family amino/carboxypeptidase